jgi:hypothetical protein
MASLSGCMQGARVVQKDALGGVVAIPNNTNMWPTYYRDEAIDMITEQYPNFDPRTDIVSEGEVVIGQQTRSDQRTDRRALGSENKPTGEVTTNLNTSSTTDKTEYRIVYRVKPASQFGNTSVNSPVQPAGALMNPDGKIAPTGKPLNAERPINMDPRTGQPYSSNPSFNSR